MIITYADENVIAEITVMQATVRMGLNRTRLMAAVEDDPDADSMEQFTRKISYPALIAASPEGLVKVGGQEIPWPPTYDQFLDFPEALAEAWLGAVSEINPHWFRLPDADPKKASNASTA